MIGTRLFVNSLGLFWAATRYPLVLGARKMFSLNSLAGASSGRSARPSTSYRYYRGCGLRENSKDFL